MRANKFAATALIAIGATGIAAGAVQAQPVSGADVETGVRGVDHGISYVTAATADRAGVTTTVEGGRFTMAPDARSIMLADAAGNVVLTVPLGLVAADRLVGLTPRIENAGRTLTLTPQSATSQTAEAIDEASDTLARKQQNAAIGALIGAGIGAVLGFFLGGVGALVTVPIGAGIGALIGYSTP